MLALTAGCAAPGAPEPPSLELARPVRDLKATRKGNEVHLTWSVPTETTDHHAFRHVGPTQICRSLGAPMHECVRLSELPTPQVETTGRARFRSGNRSPRQQAPNPQASYTDQLSPTLEEQAPTSNFVYAVNVVNSYGKSAGFSNEVQVPSAPTLSPPENFRANLTAEGVMLAWAPLPLPQAITGLRYEYRIYRHDVDSHRDSIAGELPVSEEPSPSFLDTSFEWERTYEYRATVVTIIDQANGSEQVEGGDTSTVKVVAHDVFPPATPKGLQAVFSGPGQTRFIDLVWKANSESDLAGYNIYRHEAGQPTTKVNSELIKTPAYRDPDVVPGHEYFYSVSSLDVRGNESPKSEEARETVPARQ